MTETELEQAILLKRGVVALEQIAQLLKTAVETHLLIRDVMTYIPPPSVLHGLVTEIKKLVEHMVGQQRVSTVVLRSLSRDQAKQEILDLFKSTTGPLFYSDIAERLQMDLEQVLEITNELEREGVIGEPGSHDGSIQK